MTLARLTEVLAPAVASGVGLGAFNVFSIEHAEAFAAAAEAAGTPVVLQISQNAVRYHGAYLDVSPCAAESSNADPPVPQVSKPVRKDHNRGGRSKWMQTLNLHDQKPIWQLAR